MDKKFFVHIGTHKTGTTAIQDFLKLNRKLLSKKGYLYPQKSRRDYYGLKDGQIVIPADKYKNFLKLDKLCRSKGKHVILSSETFCLIRDISPIKDALAAANVKIVCFLRRQDSFLQSYYNQSVKNGENYQKIGNWNSGFNLDYYDLLNRWATSFGKENIIVRPYEKQQFAEGSLIQDFLKTIGLELTGEFRIIKNNPNPRLPIEAIEYMRLLNSILRDKRESKAIRRQVLAFFAKKDKKNAAAIFYDHSLLDSDQNRALLTRYAASNDRVAHEFLGREDGRLFLEPPSRPSQTPRSSRIILPDERVDEITRSICRSRKNRKILLRNLKKDHSKSDAFTRYAHAKISDSLKRLL